MPRVPIPEPFFLSQPHELPCYPGALGLGGLLPLLESGCVPEAAASGCPGDLRVTQGTGLCVEESCLLSVLISVVLQRLKQRLHPFSFSCLDEWGAGRVATASLSCSSKKKAMAREF